MIMILRSFFADSIHYWERKRVIYNAVLAALVAICWGHDIWQSAVTPLHWLGAALVLFLFALGANFLYCAAYPLDLALQLTPLNRHWRRCRWLVFASGTLLASLIAVYVMTSEGMG